MGFAILAGLIWRQLGKDSARAIAVGVGAGAFSEPTAGTGEGGEKQALYSNELQ